MSKLKLVLENITKKGYVINIDGVVTNPSGKIIVLQNVKNPMFIIRPIYLKIRKRVLKEIKMDDGINLLLIQNYFL